MSEKNLVDLVIFGSVASVAIGVYLAVCLNRSCERMQRWHAERRMRESCERVRAIVERTAR